MFLAFPRATGKGLPYAASATEQFINDPGAPNRISDVELYKLPKDVFTERLALLFDTLYHSGVAPT